MYEFSCHRSEEGGCKGFCHDVGLVVLAGCVS